MTSNDEKTPVFDYDKYLLELSLWHQFSNGKKTGKHEDSPFTTGIQSRLPIESPFIAARQDTYWRSVAKPVDMQKRVDAYFLPTQEKKVNRRVYKAVEAEIIEAVPEPVSPLTWRMALAKMPQDTSPGFPLNRMGFKQKRECTAVRRRMIAMQHAFKKHWNVPAFPCVAGVRNSICKKPDNKPRLVWVYPLEVSWVEAIFALPLIDALKKCSLLAWNVGWLTGGLPGFVSSMPRKHGHGGIDISAFDASTLRTRILRAFSMLEKCVSFTKPWHRNAWRFVVNYFVDTWLLYKKDAYKKDHGVPSGSFFTQIIDSIVNAIAITDGCSNLSLIRTGRALHPRTPRLKDIFHYWNFLGDDSIFELRFDLLNGDDRILAHRLLTAHNFVWHPDKGFFCLTAVDLDGDEDDIVDMEFLGFTLKSAQDCVIDTDLLVAQMSIPDNPDQDPGDALIRLIGLGYSHGTDYEQHKLLESEYYSICKQYPDAVPSPLRKGEMRSFFLFVFRDQSFPLVFPTYNEVATRYRTAPCLMC